MSDAERLFADYVAEHQAGGEADPHTYLNRASRRERTELAALIDAYLARAPRRPFDAKDFAGSSAERTVDELERVLSGQAGLWPALLPRLRDRAGLRRAQVVEQLSDALGVGGQVDKVAGYYHEMEQGLLPSEGVSDRVLDALGRIVGESPDALREAGEVIAPEFGAGSAQSGTAFARRRKAEASESGVAKSAEASQPRWDDVDWLFRGA
jgi:hypothetical protein